MGTGFSPLDKQLEVEGERWSDGLRREAVFLSGAVSSFELVEKILARIGQVRMSRSSVWRSTQAAGERFQAAQERVRVSANSLSALWEAPSRRESGTQRQGVALDGALIPLRQEGWKEVKIGTLFDISVRRYQDEGSGEIHTLAHAVNNSYVAHLGGPETVGELTWAEACRRDWEQAPETLVIGDGAVWIWNQAALHFGDSHQLVDWYHAKQHLTSAAKLLKPEGSAAFTRWFNSRETQLYQGHADRIASELFTAAQHQPERAEDLTSEATYFRNNHLRMNYLEMREEQWPIGSGMVESAAKQFKARFGGPGMRWSRQGAENLLPIRAAVLSQSFDQVWADAHTAPPN